MNRFFIEHSSNKINFETPEKGLVNININTRGPKLGGGAFIYASSIDHTSNYRKIWYENEFALGERCVVSYGKLETIPNDTATKHSEGSTNGFIVKVNQKSFKIGLPYGAAFGVHITNKEGEYTLSINGMDADGKFYKWFSKRVTEGDLYIIDYTNIDSSDTPHGI